MAQKVRVSLEAFRTAKRSGGPGCNVARELAKLTGPERQEVAAAFKDLSISVASILRVLTERGLRLNSTSLLYHRHGRCGQCYGRPR